MTNIPYWKKYMLTLREAAEYFHIGEKKLRPFFKEDGSYDLKDSIDLGLTVDERIADGVYFAKSIRILHKLLENPELLDLPIDTEVEV